MYVEPSGGADEIFERGFHYLFFAQPATTQRLPNRFVDLIEQMPEADRPATVALVQVDDPNTTQAADIFGERLEELGIETVYDETYAPDTSNFDNIANAIKQAEPDLLISGALATDGAALVTALQRVDFSPTMLYQLNSPTDPSYPRSDRRIEHRSHLHAARLERGVDLPEQPGLRRGIHRTVRSRPGRRCRQFLHRRPGSGRRRRSDR